MKTRVNIVLATTEMSSELARIKRQVWETTYRGIYPDYKFDNFNYEKETEKFSNMIDDPQIAFYVAKYNNNIIGYMAIGKSPRNRDSKTNEIILLYLLQEFQGLGLGKQFFNIAKENLKIDGSDCFIVYYNKYNIKAHAFYKKMGCKILSIDEDDEDKSLPQIKFVYNY